MRFLLVSTLLLLLTGTFLSAQVQTVYAIEETLKLAERVPRQNAMVYLKLPLPTEGQKVSVLKYSGTPVSLPAESGPREYAWRADEVGDHDSLHVTYRILSSGIPPLTQEVIDSMGDQAFAWPPLPKGSVQEPYVLPPLIVEDLQKTEFSTIDRADTTLEDVSRLINRLDRRILTIRDLDNFDYARPLLEDVYRRRTTPRRKHLLLSLALQYLDIPHRLVSGKIASYGEVRENELWLEAALAGRWYRVYYGDGVDRSEWGEPLDPDAYLACSYDYRDMTLAVVNAAGTPPVPSILTTQAKNIIVDFWDRKNEALLAKNYAKAVTQLDSILRYLPDNIATLTEKGLVLAEAGRSEEGMPYLQHGIRTADNDLDRSLAMVQLAKLFALQRRGEEAVKALVRAYQISPVDLSILYNDYRFRWFSRQSKWMRQLEQAVQRLR